jgi:hypothetical protein
MSMLLITMSERVHCPPVSFHLLFFDDLLNQVSSHGMRDARYLGF